MAKVRFQPQEVDRLDLSEGDWITVKRDLNNGDFKKLMGAGRLVPIIQDGRPVFPIDVEEYEIERDIIYLLDWSLLGPDGKTRVEITRAALKAMTQEDFQEIHTAITNHIMARAAAKNAQRVAKTSQSATTDRDSSVQPTTSALPESPTLQ